MGGRAVPGVGSLTLTPMLCSRFLRPHRANESALHGRFYRVSEGAFNAMHAFYARTLRAAMRHCAATVSVAGLMVILTLLVGRLLPTGFIPTDDTGQIYMPTEAAQDVSFEELVRHQQAAAAIVAKNPYVDSFMSAIGGGPTASTSNQGRLFMRLKPRNQRPPADVIVQDLRKQLSVVPG